MHTTARDDELEDWARGQPVEITADPIWKLNCYREGVYAFSLARDDAAELRDHRPFGAIAEQLLRCVGSIPANIAEAYGRPTNADRVRFLSYALGSAREAITWYTGAASTLDEVRLAARIARLTRIKRMLIALLARVGSKSRGGRFERW